MMLKPCPFCGSNAVLVKKNKHKTFPWRVECMNINCACRTVRWNNPAGAASSWNKRSAALDEEPK